MCYCFNQDIYMFTSENRAHEQRRCTWIYFLVYRLFYFAGIGGVERGESTGAGADNRSI